MSNEPENFEEGDESSVNYLHRPTKTLLTGVSGSGKSEAAGRILLRSDAPIRFVFDHQGEFGPRFGFPTSRTHEDLDYLVSAMMEGKNVVVCFDPSDLFPGDTEGAFDWFCEWSLTVSQLPELVFVPKLFATDEMQDLVTTGSVCRSFKVLWTSGRKWTVDFVGIASQPNLIHNLIFNQFTRYVSFQQGSSQATTPLKKVGFDEDELMSLPPLNYIVLDRSKGFSFSRGIIRF